MKKAIETMVESIKKSIIRDIYGVNGDKVMKMIMRAYNDYQEDERDGVDYIFDINNTDDLKCCIDGGMTAKEIGQLYLGSHKDHLPLFHFGCNYPTPQPIKSWLDLRINMIAWLDDLLPYVLAYPYAFQSYRDVYTAYVTDVILGLQDTNDSYLSDLDVLAELKSKLEGMD
jgi:hypothetical protein